MSNDILAQLSRIVGEETEAGELSLTPDTVADDVPGWDSVGHSRIIVRIEEHFAIQIEDERAYSFQNVGELASYIEERRGGSPEATRAAVVLTPVAPAPVAPALRDGDDELIEEAEPSANRPPLFALFSDARYPAPYSMFHDRPGSMPGRSPDRLGFNNTDAPALPKPADEIRVFVFGNSTIRGGDIVDGLRTELARRGQARHVVYNFGMISAISLQSLMFFLWQGVNLQPDIVVTFDGYSDLGAQALGYDPRPGYPYNQYMLEIIHEAIAQDRLKELSFTREERQRRDELREAVGFKSERWREALASSYLDTIQKFHELSATYGIRCVSLLQPTLAFKKVLIGKEKVRASPSVVQHVRETYAIAREGFVDLERVMRSPSHSFVDLSRMFEDRQDQCFTDMVHLLKPCYEEVGRILADHLVPRGHG